MPVFPGINWSEIEEDIGIKKRNPTVAIENVESGTDFPQINVKNPQRNWQIKTTSNNRFLINDLTAGITRFAIDPDGYITDLLGFKVGELTLEWLEAGIYYPRFNIKNPQKTWQIENDAYGNFCIIDADTPATRFLIEASGYIRNILGFKQDLLPDADNARALGSSTLRWASLNGWNPDSHKSRHEAGGADPVANLDHLSIQGSLVIDSSLIMKNITEIQQGTLTLNWPGADVWYPRFDIKNPQRTWRIQGTPSPGHLLIYDVTAGCTRVEVNYNTAADSQQFRFLNSAGSEIMRIDYEGDMTITGKLSQGACPEFSQMTIPQIRDFLMKCRDKPEPKRDEKGRDICDLCQKPFGEGGCENPEHMQAFIENHYHKTQEEVMALMHLVLHLMERIEKLEAKVAG